MQENLQQLVAMDDFSQDRMHQKCPQTGIPADMSSQESSVAVENCTQYAWAPFLDALMAQTPSQSVHAETDLPQRDTETEPDSRFTPAEQSAHSQPLFGASAERLSSDATPEVPDCDRPNEQLADILDWMRDGTELSEVAEIGRDGDTLNIDKHARALSAREECDDIMASQAEWAEEVFEASQIQPDTGQQCVVGTVGVDQLHSDDEVMIIPQVDGPGDLVPGDATSSSAGAAAQSKRRRPSKNSASGPTNQHNALHSDHSMHSARARHTAPHQSNQADEVGGSDIGERRRTGAAKQMGHALKRRKSRKPAAVVRQGLGQFIAVTGQNSPSKMAALSQSPVSQSEETSRTHSLQAAEDPDRLCCALPTVKAAPLTNFGAISRPLPQGLGGQQCILSIRTLCEIVDDHPKTEGKVAVQHWRLETQDEWQSRTSFICPKHAGGCKFCGAPPGGFAAVRNHMHLCNFMSNLADIDLQPVPSREVAYVKCQGKCELIGQHRASFDQSMQGCGESGLQHMCCWNEDPKEIESVSVIATEIIPGEGEPSIRGVYAPGLTCAPGLTENSDLRSETAVDVMQREQRLDPDPADGPMDGPAGGGTSAAHPLARSFSSRQEGEKLSAMIDELIVSPLPLVSAPARVISFADQTADPSLARSLISPGKLEASCASLSNTVHDTIGGRPTVSNQLHERFRSKPPAQGHQVAEGAMQCSVETTHRVSATKSGSDSRCPMLQGELSSTLQACANGAIGQVISPRLSLSPTLDVHGDEKRQKISSETEKSPPPLQPSQRPQLDDCSSLRVPASPSSDVQRPAPPNVAQPNMFCDQHFTGHIQETQELFPARGAEADFEMDTLQVKVSQQISSAQSIGVVVHNTVDVPKLERAVERAMMGDHVNSYEENSALQPPSNNSISTLSSFVPDSCTAGSPETPLSDFCNFPTSSADKDAIYESSMKSKLVQSTDPMDPMMFGVQNDGVSTGDSSSGCLPRGRYIQRHTSDDEIVYVVRPRAQPPSANSLSHIEVKHKGPFYSNADDQPARPFVFAGITHRIPSSDISSLLPFESSIGGPCSVQEPLELKRTAHILTSFRLPPSSAELLRTLRGSSRKVKVKKQKANATIDNAGRTVLGESQSCSNPMSSLGGNDDEIRVLSVSQGAAPCGQRSGLVANDHGACSASLTMSAADSLLKDSESPGSRLQPLVAALGSPSKSTTPSSSSVPTPSDKRQSLDISQISETTQKYEHVSQSGFQSVTQTHGVQHLVSYSMELHARSRGSLRPNPELDPILAIIYCVRNETLQSRCGAAASREGAQYSDRVGCMVVSDQPDELRQWCPSDAVHWVMDSRGTEPELILAFIDNFTGHDPDFLIGYEIETASFGYLIQRAAVLQRQGTLVLQDVDIESALSRILQSGNERRGQPRQSKSEQAQRGEQYLANQASGIRCQGRNALNLWRILRSEIKLNKYSAENVALHVLQRHLPHFRFSDLTLWFDTGGRTQWRLLEYYLMRTRLNIQIIDQLDIIGRTSELARVFGIDFFSVLWRGSQYRVESMMIRLAKRHQPPYMAVSPSKQQVAAQDAISILPLVCEPFSRLYTAPVAVLDFRSLYPSVIIAYNICYSTCLGKISTAPSTTSKKFGARDDYALPPGELRALEDQLDISPNEVMFVKKSTRQGILPRMLTEILEARIKVKKEMKQAKNDPVLYRILNAKQFALKLIANVTYGYTSASFSGRMPCSDIADAIGTH